MLEIVNESVENGVEFIEKQLAKMKGRITEYDDFAAAFFAKINPSAERGRIGFIFTL